MGCCQSQNTNHKQTYNKPAAHPSKLKPINQEQSVDKGHNDSDQEHNKLEMLFKQGRIEKLEDMINSGELDPNKKINENYTLLLYSVVKQVDIDFIRFLLNKGADINAKELETGNTALFFASLDLNSRLVDLLINFKPDISHQNLKGENIFKFLENNIENRGVHSIDKKLDDNEIEVLDKGDDSFKHTKSLKKLELSPEDQIAYQNILSSLEEYSQNAL